MARRRSLRPEEEELWSAVARTARAMHPKSQPLHRVAELPAHPVPDHAPPKPHHPVLPPFRLGSKPGPATAIDLAPSPGQALAAQPLRMDAKTHGKMTRGRLVPEARLDLHGLTLAEAQPELVRFVLNAQSGGLRLVLVITGKGKVRDDQGPIPQRTGLLRHQVPVWLRQAPLGPAVLQVTEAHLKHGGSGAYYVYLRRGR
ncbi:Smr/MutS family protein [Neotabrizicola shimadae]|uniref:Smr/MutS family protein n=1 Tax=Neotabrizicola shimadae TaxID=2807096 RepID=A0A8G0ZV59_9RHOB|nr:Smr/MutS family protein [Neotabrizicola shimadae]QYZ69427.1 Smr/MutS family protein [Neotabrizicola shimadae]